MSYQQIETLVQQLKSKPSFGGVRKMTKFFSQYTNLDDTLPPENLMVFAIFQLPEYWNKVLKLKDGEPLYDQPALGTSLYVKLYLKTLTKLLEQTAEEQVQHIILQGMIKTAHLTLPYRPIYRAWAKAAMNIWATGSLGIKIRAFSLLNAFLSYFQDEQKTWVIRRCYLKFMQNCKQVSWRSFEAINLMVNSFCQLCRVCPDIAYFVAFGNLRLILIQIDKTNKQSKHKRKALIKKLYSFQILNCLKLLSSIITRVDHPSISPLIYPLVQSLEVYSKMDLSTQYMPLRLHVLAFLQQISQRTGTFIPYLIELSTRELQCKQFLKFKPKSTQKNESDLALIYQIAPKAYKSTQFWSEAFQQIIKKIYTTSNLLLRYSSAPQILGQLLKTLHKQYKSIKFTGYKIQIKYVLKNIRLDIDTLILKRYKKHKLPASYPLTKLSNLDLEIVKQHEKNTKQDLLLLKQKLAAQFDDIVQDEQQYKQGNQQYDEQEQEQGYEQDNEGASEYNPSEKQDSEADQGQMQNISYEGDPDNVDELLRQWSEHEWSSQDQM